MLKAVIDANVWIGAIAANGVCRSVLTAFKQDLFIAIYPMHLLFELEDVLQRLPSKHPGKFYRHSVLEHALQFYHVTK